MIPFGTGWWTRKITADQRLGAVQQLTEQLGAGLRDLVIRDLEGLACRNGRKPLEAS